MYRYAVRTACYQRNVADDVTPRGQCKVPAVASTDALYKHIRHRIIAAAAAAAVVVPYCTCPPQSSRACHTSFAGEMFDELCWSFLAVEL